MKETLYEKIYIPLWLDLLYPKILETLHEIDNLHSTMVRFIILYGYKNINFDIHLHSTMVRFIMIVNI